MNISTKTRYGFRLMIYLGLYEGDSNSVQLGEIAEKEGISLKYLERIVQMLKHGGWVSVKRGPHGGYRLSKESRAISLLGLFKTLEGGCTVIDCLGHDVCNRVDGCTSSGIWGGLSKAIESYFADKTLEDVILDYKERNKTFFI